jgi:hypothetical protein
LGQVVRIVANENQRPAIELITLHILRNRLARCANFVKQANDGHRDIEPPISVALDLLASEQLPFPSLTGIVEAPILRPDGTLLQSPGYDGATRLFYLPASDLQGCDVPDHPTSDDVESARATIADSVGEFPFVDRASLANLYALFLTPILRPTLKGHVPLAIIDAPQAGTGKGLLSNCVSLITSGHSASMTTLPDNEEEVRKRLTALLLDGPNIIVVDNIERPLGSPSLAAILTSDVWTDRILGRTETVSLQQRATWIANGNNLQLCGDLPRRSYWIRLDARMARPWERQSFRHPDLSTWVLQNHGKLLAALLTLARYWYTLGCPAVAVRPLGGFETWTNTVGGVLAAAGITGFLENQELVYSRADAGVLGCGRDSS